MRRRHARISCCALPSLRYIIIHPIVHSFSFCNDYLSGLPSFPLFEGSDTSDSEEICDELTFDALVEGRLTGEGWRQVDLEKPRVQLVVYEDVETQELETVVAEGHILLTGVENHVFS
jgi:hypothetical protein